MVFTLVSTVLFNTYHFLFAYIKEIREQ